MNEFDFDIQIFGDSGENIENTVVGKYIYATSVNDTIHNQGSESTIYAGSGNDYIENYSANTSINGCEGADTICNTTTTYKETITETVQETVQVEQPIYEVRSYQVTVPVYEDVYGWVPVTKQVQKYRDVVRYRAGGGLIYL